ncbi:protein GPR15LG [Antechinus flavipes]|uniref:protein GPR15LG n=1 Tax=Antechinus flavipes TaxID=38775 RepID=UPI0022365841|nr:protein GPR15LG [Antechinus flavipes]
MKFPNFTSLLYILFLCLLAFSTEGARRNKPRKGLCCHNGPNHAFKSLKGRNPKMSLHYKLCKGKISPCKKIPGALPQI